MKKLLLTAVLGVVAFVVAPIATANAGKFAGACVIHGTAKFTGGPFGNGRLPTGTTPFPGMGYEFESAANPAPPAPPTTLCVHLNVTEAEATAKDLSEEPTGGGDAVMDVTELLAAHET